MEIPASPGDTRVRVVVATTVLLSFISFWRAAAIVLSDLGSTAFYVGGIVEQAIGKSAPWFVLGSAGVRHGVAVALLQPPKAQLPQRADGEG